MEAAKITNYSVLSDQIKGGFMNGGYYCAPTSPWPYLIGWDIKIDFTSFLSYLRFVIICTCQFFLECWIFTHLNKKTEGAQKNKIACILYISSNVHEPQTTLADMSAHNAILLYVFFRIVLLLWRLFCFQFCFLLGTPNSKLYFHTFLYILWFSLFIHYADEYSCISHFFKIHNSTFPSIYNLLYTFPFWRGKFVEMEKSVKCTNIRTYTNVKCIKMHEKESFEFSALGRKLEKWRKV